MFVLAALIVDMGLAKVMRRNAQAAADSAALAAVNVLYANSTTPDFAGAVAAVKQYAAANVGTTTADWSSCAAVTPLPYTPVGQSTCISFDSATAPTNVRVIIPPKHAPSFFGAVVGYRGVDVNAYAQAAVASTATPPCAFCVLDSTSHSIQNASIYVIDGNARINGSLDQNPQGGVTTTNGTTYIEGTVNRPGNMGGTVVYGAPPIADPLAFLADPPSDLGALSPLVKTDPCTQGPGYYGAVSRNNGTCVLTSGLYVFTDPFSLGGNATVSGTGVTLYFACGASGVVASCVGDPAASQGGLQSGGNSSFSFTAPSSGPRKGLVMADDRANTSTLTLNGSDAGTVVTGTIYAPGVKLKLQGNGCGAAFRSQVVFADFDGVGNPACFTTTYDASLNVDLPSTSDGLVL
jgi:hypothetical protein